MAALMMAAIAPDVDMPGILPSSTNTRRRHAEIKTVRNKRLMNLVLLDILLRVFI
jgi:hypothetical protein